MPLGPRDTQGLALPVGWDAIALQQFRLADGATYLQAANRLLAAIGALNAELQSDPFWGTLLSYTDQPELKYRDGASNGVGRYTEYSRADAKRAGTIGHMLPLLDWDRALGWTWKYLKDARLDDIDSDIADAVQDWRDRVRLQILTRLLKRGDDSGENNGLGTTGLSAGFATAAASTGVDFQPPSFGGNTFTSDHEHYVGIAGGAFTANVFKDAKLELKEHGHPEPYSFMVGTADESTVKGLSDFVPTPRSLVAHGANTDLARANGNGFVSPSGAYVIGTIEDFLVHVVPGMPQYYGFGWKPYGIGSQRNPLRVRLQRGQERPAISVMTDPRAGNATTPLQYVMTYFEFGVGVANRTNGTARYVNNATWADGTPT